MLAVTVVMVVFLVAINAFNYLTMVRDTTKTMQLILAGDTAGMPEGGGLGGPGAAMGPANGLNGSENGTPPGNGPGGPGDSGTLPESLPEPPEGAGTPPESLPELPEGAVTPPEKPDGTESVPEKPTDTLTEEALASERYFSVRLTKEGKTIDLEMDHINSMDDEAAEELAEEAAAAGTREGHVGRYRFRRIDDAAAGGSRYVFLDTGQQQKAVLRTLAVTIIVGAVTWLLMLLLVIFLSKRAILPIAQNIERQKQFVTDAGHEIKTPLAIIQANADVLELRMGDNKWISNIRSQVTRLSSLTQNLLTLSRMEEGDTSSVPTTLFDTGEAMREVVETFRELAQTRGLKIEESAESGVRMRWHRESFVRLISILMENAVKYAQEGGTISIVLKKEGKEAVVVQKNPVTEKMKEDPDRLFDRFYRADKARTQSSGGSGIGLSVARAVTEQAGGHIHAVYESGQVIVFTIRLPLNNK